MFISKHMKKTIMIYFIVPPSSSFYMRCQLGETNAELMNWWTEKGNMMARDGPHFFVETARHVYISIVIQYLMTSDIWCHVSTAVSSNIGSVSTVVRISNKACWEKRSASSSFPWRKELLACKIKDETTNCTTEI